MANYETGFEKIVPKYMRNKFENFSDESGVGDGYWGYLVPGYRCEDTGCHIVHEWTKKDFLASVRNSIVKCDCADCFRRKADRGTEV